MTGQLMGLALCQTLCISYVFPPSHTVMATSLNDVNFKVKEAKHFCNSR